MAHPRRIKKARLENFGRGCADGAEPSPCTLRPTVPVFPTRFDGEIYIHLHVVGLQCPIYSVPIPWFL